MGKNKKKKDRKKIKDAVPNDLFDAAALSVRRFRKVTNEISKLSTGQKLVGSLVLVAAGLIYLDQRKGKDDDGKPRHVPKFDWPRLSEASVTSATEDEPAEAAALKPAVPHKSHKSVKPRKPHGSAARKATDYADDM